MNGNSLKISIITVVCSSAMGLVFGACAGHTYDNDENVIYSLGDRIILQLPGGGQWACEQSMCSYEARQRLKTPEQRAAEAGVYRSAQINLGRLALEMLSVFSMFAWFLVSAVLACMCRLMRVQ